MRTGGLRAATWARDAGLGHRDSALGGRGETMRRAIRWPSPAHLTGKFFRTIMAVMNAPLAVEPIVERRRAAALMHPIRTRILGLAAEPASATEIADRLGQSRQSVNYHVRALARAGFLKRAGQRRKRNLVEQRYVATARGYVLTPEVLGPAAPDWRRIEDTMSAAYLMALTAQLQSDLAAASAGAQAEGKRLPTMSMHAELRFETADQRTAFTRALHAAILDVVARHSSPSGGRAYRLVLGCCPIRASNTSRRSASHVESSDDAADA